MLPADSDTLYFNPHSPCGERLPRPVALSIRASISIHTPLAGSDAKPVHPAAKPTVFQSTLPLRGATMQRLRRGQPAVISIHTPLAGSDERIPSQWRTGRDFNPHSPCGERPQHLVSDLRFLLFQSTLPLRGATPTISDSHMASVISIHTPLAGSDQHRADGVDDGVAISIHTPLAGSDYCLESRTECAPISIHTPLAGSD